MSQRLLRFCPSVQGSVALSSSFDAAARFGRYRSWLATLVATLLVAACGGGGGNGEPAPTPYSVRMAWAQLLAAPHSWTLAGTAPNAQAFTLTLAFAPLPDAPFPVTGAMAKRTAETITLGSAGQSSTGTLTLYLDQPSLAFIGFEADGICSVATSNTALPESALIGASGAIFALSDLDSCQNNAVAVGTTTSTWSLEIDSGVGLLCWNMASADSAGVPNGSTSTCVEISADGTLGTRARYVLSADGVEVRARNF